MQGIKTISFIGSGNVATHLAKELYLKGYTIQQICSRYLENANILANQVEAQGIDHLDALDTTVDLIFCCTKDDLIKKIINRIVDTNNIHAIVHTSGTVGLEVFNDFEDKIINKGIFYPLQSFSKTVPVNFKTIPIGITTTNNLFEAQLLQIANTISEKAFVITDNDRKHLHLSAVLVNNFTNHLFALGQQYCEQHQLDFKLLLPLIQQTIQRIETIAPINAQTGPAKRKDFEIINNHINMLNNNELVQAIYISLTNSILDFYKDSE
ncbi:MAG: DUF2520 domain-containing protein [Chitinophagales bacterium]|nr:DUF2520 domain-containing protein [Chitinophagales bacterium]